jgi:hypothetical protein
MPNHPHIVSATGGKVLPFLILAFGMLLAVTMPVAAVDLDELTVVTLARDGSWGVATAGSQGEAIAVAIRDCRTMAAAPTDCGAQFVTTRGGWVVANLCGDHQIIVAAETREAVEQAAGVREEDMRRSYAPDMPPCRRILTLDPAGAVLLGQAASAPRIVAHRGAVSTPVSACRDSRRQRDASPARRGLLVASSATHRPSSLAANSAAPAGAP